MAKSTLVVTDPPYQTNRKTGNNTTHTEGDGSGYGIRSYNLNGEVKYIEVKTTRIDKHL
ncbi:protein NO VEIN domain-containing protein [Priestia megaterium]|uniref:protein NO VEIN domain-containing protein n=1 Tax=Priestia megaterium TaxID=1404 RepID=UPI003312FF5D